LSFVHNRFAKLIK
jgi:hypothetical protein